MIKTIAASAVLLALLTGFPALAQPAGSVDWNDKRPPIGAVVGSLGVKTPDDCTKWDAGGNLVSAGAPCGGGGASTNGANGDILRGNGAGGFGTALTPGTGVAAFLATPIAGIPATWLQSGAAVASLGFTPPPNTRTVNTSGLLSGGGNLTADRTITMANAPANTLLGNPTGSSAAPTTITLGANLSFSGGALVASGGGGSPGGSDGQIQYRVNSTTFGGATVGTGLQMVGGVLSPTSVINDQDGGNYTVVTGDAAKTVLVGGYTYTLPQAGSAGFESGWSACFLNTGTGDATLNATTSTFPGAGGGTSLILLPGDTACPTSNGTNYPTVMTRRSPEMHLAIGWVAGVDPNKAVIFTARRAMVVTDIRGTVADPVGTAATAVVYKAPSGTVCGSGTAQHSGTFNANGTAATNQTLTLAGGAANQLSAGDRLCLATTGGAAWTGGVGNGGITVTARAL